MKTKYKFIHFVKIADRTKTSVWSCRNNKSNVELGEIKWYSPWQQYCYFTATSLAAVYNVECLEDINDFIKQLK